MLILPGRGFPLFSSWWFFILRLGQAGAEKAPIPAEEGASPHPEPSGKAEPPCTTRPGFCFPHKSFGVPLPPPAARWLWPRCPGCRRQEGTQGQGFPQHCPHQGDAVPGTHLVPGVPFLHLFLGSWAFGVALGNSPPREEEGRGPLVVTQVWGVALTAPYPCPQSQQGGSLRGNHWDTDRSIPGRSRWSVSTCPGVQPMPVTKLTSGSSCATQWTEMVEMSWEVEAEPPHSWFVGDFWCRGPAPPAGSPRRDCYTRRFVDYSGWAKKFTWR